MMKWTFLKTLSTTRFNREKTYYPGLQTLITYQLRFINIIFYLRKTLFATTPSGILNWLFGKWMNIVTWKTQKIISTKNFNFLKMTCKSQTVYHDMGESHFAL